MSDGYFILPSMTTGSSYVLSYFNRWINILSLLSLATHPMSAALIEANLCLTHGQRQSTNPKYYTFYTTALECASGHILTANVRFYSPPNEPLLPQASVVHLVGRFIAPTSSTVLIDTLDSKTYPGDPTDDNYETHIPDDSIPRITVVGSVIKESDLKIDTAFRNFKVMISDYVRDCNRSCVAK